MTEVRVPAGTGQDAAGDNGQQPAPPGATEPRSKPNRPAASGAYGLWQWLRWGWHQLTSMRTALILLFLLALASVPGSVLPQQGINPQAVTQYYAAHPSLAPWLARFSLFNVFAAPWFAAIYLLLFLSLAGCVMPRTFRLVGVRPAAAAAGAAEPVPAAARAPAMNSPLPPDAALAAAADAAGRQAVPGAHRGRLGVGGKGLPARGRQPAVPPRAAGPAVPVGMGGMFGYKADRLLVQGQSFGNTVTALDQFRPGPAGLGGRPAAVHDRAWTGSTRVRHVRAGHGAAVVVPRLPQLPARSPVRRCGATTSRSTTR